MSHDGKLNILMIAIDSLRRDHLSCYGYEKLTTPYIDEFAEEAVLFEDTFSAHIPTTPGYSSMLTGRDCFGTEVVALRHQGGLTEKVKTLPEILAEHGYNSTAVGYQGNPGSRGFQNYVNYGSGWGGWENRPLRKAEELNAAAVPEIARLQAEGKPWLCLLRHMDPHSPYLPPAPYDRMFYSGDECDPTNDSMKPVMAFKPFCDYFGCWMPPGITDKDYVNAQYDGAVCYMDACIQVLFRQLEGMGILDDTIVVINSDHGETLYDHECWFDHHGMYDPTLVIPLIIRYPEKLPMGLRVAGYNQQKDLVPTLLELAEIETDLPFEGRPLTQLVWGEEASFESEFYIMECTWMRKHGWRTPEWKLIVALEPDFHFKPEVELYNLVRDPEEYCNVADENPALVATLRARMDAFIAKREQEQGITNPMLTQGEWNNGAPYATSEEAYNTMHIGDPETARRLQAESRK